MRLERGGRHPVGCGEESEHEGAEDGSADDFFKLLLHDGTCLGVELGKHNLFPHDEYGFVFVVLEIFVEVRGVFLGSGAVVVPLHGCGFCMAVLVDDGIDGLLGHGGTCLGKSGLGCGIRQRMLTCKQMRGD